MRRIIPFLLAGISAIFIGCSGGGDKSEKTADADTATVGSQQAEPGENVALNLLEGGSIALVEWKSLGQPDSVCVFYVDSEGDLWDTNVMRLGRRWKNVADTAAMTAMIPSGDTDTARVAFNPGIFTEEAALVRANLIPLHEIRQKAAVALKRQTDEVTGLVKAAAVSSFPTDYFAEPLRSVYGKHINNGDMEKVYLAVKMPELGTDGCADFSTPIKEFKINCIDFEAGKVDYTFKSIVHNDCDGSTYTETTSNVVWVTRKDGRLLIAKSADEGYVFLP